MQGPSTRPSASGAWHLALYRKRQQANSTLYTCSVCWAAKLSCFPNRADEGVRLSSAVVEGLGLLQVPYSTKKNGQPQAPTMKMYIFLHVYVQTHRCLYVCVYVYVENISTMSIYIIQVCIQVYVYIYIQAYGFC